MEESPVRAGDTQGDKVNLQSIRIANYWHWPKAAFVCVVVTVMAVPWPTTTRD
ncbi:hypothetical protein [Microbulbifer sp. 2205BS26-8]|uniref:hypothetical protein n=1 Tax=Microbulbifer sp. 2205BS26-8 TaxID=3064386 RepID=UPI00273F0B2A|nr:hypothetical protein [Microbulbifer sp. 2205BS26-8]MDP5211048.1 hypothetical protein [Microbulbifer sp. 2205BS26-8]